MKQLTAITALVVLVLPSFAQTSNPKFDKALADSLGADKHGMKPYVFVILKTGPNKITDKEKLNELFRGHMSNINRLAEAGKLVVAGPFMKNDKSYRGIFILNAKTIAEANELLSTDPAINEKIFDTETFEWYGSAALPMYLPFHEKTEEQKP